MMKKGRHRNGHETRTRRKRLDARFGMVVPTEELDAYQARAEADGFISISAWVRAVLKREIARQK